MHKKKSREETLLFRYLFIVRRRFAKIDETLPGKKPNRHNTDLIECHEGYRHHYLIDNIRGWGKDGGENEVDKNGIFSVAIEKSNVDQPGFGEKDHKNGHLENHPKSQKQPGSQSEIFAHRRQGSEKFIIITNQKFEGGRENDKISEGRPADKAGGGEKGEGNQHPLFMPIKPGSNKAPDLRKDHRRRKQHAAD